MSDSSQLALYYKVEVTYGTDPGGNGNEFRFTSESLGQDTDFVSSQEIRSDRQVPSVVRTGIKGSGTVGIEISCGAHDAMLEAALLSANWTSPTTVAATTISFTSPGTIADSANGFGAFAAGDIVYVKGAALAVNNGWQKVTAASAASLTVTGHNLTTAIAGPSVSVIKAAKIQTGTTLRSFMLEKKFADIASTFELMYGACVDTLAIDIPQNGLVTGSIGFIGQKSVSAAATTMGSATAAPTLDTINTIDNVPQAFEGSILTASAISIVSASLNLANSLRARMQVGTLGAASVGTGTIAITGTVRMYFSTATIMDKYLNATATALAFALHDATNAKGYFIDLPAVKFTAGRRVAGGLSQDIIADMSFTAYRDATTGYMMRIFRA